MAKKKTEESFRFEDAMGQLEAIVRQLEDGGCSLDEALENYSNAIQLLKRCHSQLDVAQRKVEILSGIDAQGNPITQPLGDESFPGDEKQDDAPPPAGTPKASQRRNLSADKTNELF
ncbi:MAG: exodeoxyribonuclease VII small subunit [Planctomycetales bacterium]|nr:exodeoxyribonuclease VII small subunit [Planctomycetales bacterium]